MLENNMKGEGGEENGWADKKSETCQKVKKNSLSTHFLKYAII